MELSWLTEHVWLGQWFKEESPLSAIFNYFCILGKKKRKKKCLVPSESQHFRRECQKAQSLKGLLHVIMATLNFRTAMMTSSLTCKVTPWWDLIRESWCLNHSVGAEVAKQPLLAFPLPCTPCLLLLSRLTLLSLMVIVSSWSTLGFIVGRLTGTMPLFVGF